MIGRASAPAAAAVGLPIRWRDLDPLGHVNHEVYLTYLEHSRDTWFAMNSDGTLGPADYVVARLEIDYLRELTIDHGAVDGCCRLAKIGRSSLVTEEALVMPDGRLAARARAVLVFWNAETRSSRPMTPEERAGFENGVALGEIPEA